MPSRHVIRNFVENGYYHVFNRGVEKRNIFLDEQDYNMFLYYLYVYLMPLEEVLVKYPLLPPRLQSKNLNLELDLITYCLMPNHFHLLLRQETKDAIPRFMKQLTNAYTFYFNQKYERVGGLVQGRFKAIMIETDELLLHISRYIHLNPFVSEVIKDLDKYKWSSYADYLGKDVAIRCTKEVLLSYFPSPEGYKQFILDQVDYARELERIKHLALEN